MKTMLIISLLLNLLLAFCELYLSLELKRAQKELDEMKGVD